MFSRMLIRKKLLWGTILLVGTLLLLMVSSLRGVLAYRELTKSIGALSYEFQDMWSFGQDVAELSSYYRQPPSLSASAIRSNVASSYSFVTQDKPTPVRLEARERSGFFSQLNIVRWGLNSQAQRIHKQIESDPLLTASEAELELIEAMRDRLRNIEDIANDYHLPAETQSKRISNNLDDLNMEARALFNIMTQRMRSLRADMRSRYHAWIAVIVTSSTVAFFIVGFSFWFFRRGVVQPFKVLLNGSRRIAKGDFDHRIYLQSHDELAELADAQNKMTARFVEIRENLNEKVQQRTREVVRSEQLASVGFLAAGVAHEINNPLASIAWSAEALESRLHEILHAAGFAPAMESDAEANEQVEVLRKYLKRIQDEAFRCKGITERLLDFSRLGESQRKQETDIHESVSDVIALVRHLGQYRNRRVDFSGQTGIVAWVSPTEFKQVVLNLLTNSLDASDDGGVVRVTLTEVGEQFSLTVSDDGCGMNEEVIHHLFEPFFTRRRDGRGTGLGLSISYRIVQDHGGSLTPTSSGPGQGSTFVLTMPLEIVDDETHERLQAAA
ncbi:MAG: HAMP domain-containing sensor histidine kinase [Pirellulaceae bacterium]